MKKIHQTILVLYAFLVLLIYLWTSSTSFFPPFQFQFSKTLGQYGANYHFRGPGTIDYYNALSDGFLDGHLYLSKIDYCPYDCSRFENKCFLYFGPVPALILFIPFRFFFGGLNLPSDLAVPLFAFAAFLFMCRLLLAIKKRFFTTLSFWPFFLSIIYCSCCNALPHTLRDIEVYQVPIAAGNAFLALSLYLFAQIELERGRQPLRLFALSLSLGLMIGSRALHFPLACFLIAFSFFRLRTWRRKKLSHTLCLTAPFLVLLTGYAWYNYARFHNLFEVGANYIRPFPGNFTNPSVIASKLWGLFCGPLKVQPTFPFIFPTNIPHPPYFYEALTGLFTSTPLILIIPCVLLYTRTLFKKWLFHFLLFLVTAGFMVVIMISCAPLVGIAPRYISDFSILFLIPSVICFWMIFRPDGRQGLLLRILRSGALTLLFMSITINIALSLYSNENRFEQYNPAIYKSMAHFFTNLTS